MPVYLQKVMVAIRVPIIGCSLDHSPDDFEEILSISLPPETQVACPHVIKDHLVS